MNLSQVVVRPVEPSEESTFQELMQQYHYLGALPKIGNTIWYVVTCNNEWLGLLSFSAAALKCGARDRWIGWGYRLQYDRLHLVANNSRFLILPTCHYKNLASKILSLCRRRIQKDWQDRFGFSPPDDGNLCRPLAFHRHDLSRRKLAINRQHQRISTNSKWLQ